MVDHRSKTYKDLAQITPRIEELLNDEIDGVEYEYRKESRCRVCSTDNDLRKLIDTLLIYPKSYQETLELATPLMEAKDIPAHRRPTYQSIRNHQKRHLPFDKLAVREIAERRAKDRGKRILEGKDNLLTAEAFFETIAQRAFNSLVNGEVNPTLSQGMQAMNILDRLDKDSDSSMGANELLVQLHIIIQAVREVVPPQMWDRISEKIESAQQELKERSVGNDQLPEIEHGGDEEVVDAEIVEPERN